MKENQTLRAPPDLIVLPTLPVLCACRRAKNAGLAAPCGYFQIENTAMARVVAAFAFERLASAGVCISAWQIQSLTATPANIVA